MASRRPLGPRVDDLERNVAELQKTTGQLRRDQDATRKLAEGIGKRVEELADRVDKVVPLVGVKLDEQTKAINQHADEQIETLTSFVVDKLVESARQWPASAIVACTAALGLIVGIILLAAGAIHLG